VRDCMHAVFNKTVEIATSGCRRLRGLPRPTAAVGRPAVGARRPRKTSVRPTDRAQQCTRKSFDAGQGGRKQAMKTRATTANEEPASRSTPRHFLMGRAPQPSGRGDVSNVWAVHRRQSRRLVAPQKGLASYSTSAISDRCARGAPKTEDQSTFSLHRLYTGMAVR
jgi:hypothetical protein